MGKPPSSQGKRIIVDWGTTSFRAVLLDADGNPRDTVENGRGIAVISAQTHEKELIAQIGPWLDAHGPLPIYATGMITSRNGWLEVPYVSCPASLDDLVAGVVHLCLANGSQLHFLPGIEDPSRRPFPDVMRGEETQIAGCGLDRNATIVLPGTHSKWARVAGGRITGFQTYVTGELFALLTRHSFLARQDLEDDAEHPEAFDRGVTQALDDTAGNTGLPALLFSVRTGMLAGELAPAEIRDYLSGLLIGHEFLCALACGWSTPGADIVIAGNDGLNARYSRAARKAGVTVAKSREDAAVRGALSLAIQLERRQNGV